MSANFALRIIITGRVQGVFFRDWTVTAAETIGISGWVRNRQNGSVEIFAQAPRNLLDKFVVMLRSGPKNARVDTLNTEQVDAADYRGFARRPTI